MMTSFRFIIFRKEIARNVTIFRELNLVKADKLFLDEAVMSYICLLDGVKSSGMQPCTLLYLKIEIDIVDESSL